MSIELELTSIRLSIQFEELNTIDPPHRFHTLVAPEEQRKYSLNNLKKLNWFTKIRRHLLASNNLLSFSLFSRLIKYDISLTVIILDKIIKEFLHNQLKVLLI